MRETSTVAGWILFVMLIICAVVSTVFTAWWLIFAWMAIISFYLGWMIEVKGPDVAYHFRFGRFRGKLNAGWHLPIPFVEEIRLFDREVIVFTFEEETMFTGQPEDKNLTQVSADIMSVIQIGELEEDLRKALEVNPEDRDGLLQKIVLSKLRTEVGRGSFAKINRTQKTSEKRILELIEKEVSKYGYHALEVELSDIQEHVISKAQEVEIVGDAKGKAAKATADALKDNWPGAMVEAVRAWADGKRLSPEAKEQKKKRDKYGTFVDTAGDVTIDVIKKTKGGKKE